jgi:SH3-like domain-containing protein
MSWLLKARALLILAALIGLLQLTLDPVRATTRSADDPASIFLKAANKTLGAAASKATTQVVLSNFSPDLAEQLQIDPATEITFIDLTATYSGENRTTLQRIDPLFGGGVYPETGLEILQIDGQYYLHGPVPILGAPQKRWYTDPSLELYLPTLDQYAPLRDLIQTNLKQMKAQKDQQIEGLRCKTYTLADRKVAAKALSNVYGGLSQFDDSRIINPALTTAICSDGYVRKVELTFDFDCGCQDGSVQGSTDQTLVAYLPAARPSNLIVTYTISAEYRLFEKPIKITAPTNVLPLEAVQQDYGLFEAVVFNGGNIRAEPSMRGQVLGQLHAGQVVQLMERTADATWFYVNAPEATGWVSATLLTLYEGLSQNVPITGQTTAAPAQTNALTARVYNGGNVRATPNTKGAVLDQINAGETVTLIQQTRDGVWYQITNIRGVTGWVHRTLLTIDPAIAKRVPVAK